MPIYEYECAKCRKVHEIIQKFSDKPLKKCPDCQGPIQKLMSMSSFALKGAGWYTTDYKAKAPGSTAPKTESKTDGAAATGDTSAAKPKSENSAKPAKTGDSGSKSTS